MTDNDNKKVSEDDILQELINYQKTNEELISKLNEYSSMVRSMYYSIQFETSVRGKMELYNDFGYYVNEVKKISDRLYRRMVEDK